jgi:hypothetical protein
MADDDDTMGVGEGEQYSNEASIDERVAPVAVEGKPTGAFEEERRILLER